MTVMTNLYDMTKCTACRGCLVACKDWNQLPAVIEKFTGSYQAHEETNGDTFTIMKFFEFYDGSEAEVRFQFLKYQCMHCQDPSCLKACPQKCYSISEQGAVTHDASKCVGCQYCSYACPFSIPKRRKREDIVTKCTLCQDRLQEGLGDVAAPLDYFRQKPISERVTTANKTPACVRNCPTGALLHGPRHELLQLAKDRIHELRSQGYPHATLYGEQENLNKLYVLADTPDKYGLPLNPSSYAVIDFWKNIVQPYVGWLIPLALAGSAVSFFTARIMANKYGTADEHHEEGGSAHADVD